MIDTITKKRIHRQLDIAVLDSGNFDFDLCFFGWRWRRFRFLTFFFLIGIGIPFAGHIAILTGNGNNEYRTTEERKDKGER